MKRAMEAVVLGLYALAIGVSFVATAIADRKGRSRG
jgi:hypothetical protein